MAIEGVQPNIPENPVATPSQTLTSMNKATGGLLPIPPAPMHPVNAMQTSSTGAHASSGSSATSTTTVVETLEGQKYTVKHHLSKEHQMYYETVGTVQRPSMSLKAMNFGTAKGLVKMSANMSCEGTCPTSTLHCSTSCRMKW